MTTSAPQAVRELIGLCVEAERGNDAAALDPLLTRRRASCLTATDG